MYGLPSTAIGQALLQRYEALASKHDAVSKQCGDQVRERWQRQGNLAGTSH
jgi:hypothetical protein